MAKFSKQKCLIISVYSFMNILGGATISLQGPFFPMIAQEKGASPFQNGLVFGVYSLTNFIFCLFTGALVNRFGAFEINFTGLLTIGISSIMFGFVYLINGVQLFIGISILIRILEAVGFTMFRNAVIVIILSEFPENVESSLAIVQMFHTVGNVLGPVIGGVLYEWGGFVLPFLSVGVLLLCSALAVIFLTKKYPGEEAKSMNDILKFLRLPSVILGAFSIYVSCNNVGFILSTLEPHIRILNLSPVEVGALFLCIALSFSLSSYGYGKLCEKYGNTFLICSVSALIAICGLCLLGPAPYLNIDMNIYTSTFSLLITGLGIGGEQIGGFSLLNKGAKLANFPQNLQIFGIISAIFTSSVALGLFTGPVFGGYFVEKFQYVWSSHFFILLNLAVCIGNAVCICFDRKRQEEVNEETKLLESQE